MTFFSKNAKVGQNQAISGQKTTFVEKNVFFGNYITCRMLSEKFSFIAPIPKKLSEIAICGPRNSTALHSAPHGIRFQVLDQGPTLKSFGSGLTFSDRCLWLNPVNPELSDDLNIVLDVYWNRFQSTDEWENITTKTFAFVGKTTTKNKSLHVYGTKYTP